MFDQSTVLELPSSSQDEKPQVIVEVLIRSESAAFSTQAKIRDEVADWLTNDHEGLIEDRYLTGYDRLPHADSIESIKVDEILDCRTETQIADTDAMDLELHIYEAHPDSAGHGQYTVQLKDTAGPTTDDRDEVASGPTTEQVMSLPNKALQHEWDSLVFDDDLHRAILHYAISMMTSSDAARHGGSSSFSRIVLFHGPPGTGKTSLCRALAQKLSIRLGHRFVSGLLIEVDSSALLSRWFGESGRLVKQLFDDIAGFAKVESVFVCVIIDEVESLVSRRDPTDGGRDCRDGLRATNQLLTALDQIKSQPNVLILCTSNLRDSLDPAFTSRVDVERLVPLPGHKARYTILRDELHRMIQAGRTSPSQPRVARAAVAREPGISDEDDMHVQDHQESDINAEIELPSYVYVQACLYYRVKSPGRRLWDLATRSEGMDGRGLRKLPSFVRSMKVGRRRYTLHDALTALEAAVTRQQRGARKD